MLRLAAEHGGNPDDPNKRDPLDFVLWQPSLPDEPAWESRWGPGRPGWHIECSALALRELGDDDRPPRRRARPGLPPPRVRDRPVRVGHRADPFVRHWLHVGLVGLGGTKMSKSLGNLVFVADLLKDYEPMAVRLALLGHHYRVDWEWEGRDARGADGAARAVAGGTDRRHRRGARRRSDDVSTTTSTPPAALAALDGLAAAGRAVSVGRRAPRGRAAERGPIGAVGLPWVLRAAGNLPQARRPAGPPRAGECPGQTRSSDARQRDSPTPRRLDQGAGRGTTAGAELAAVDREPAGHGRGGRRRSTARRSTCRTALPDGAQVSMLTGDTDGRARGAPPLDRARAGPGGAPAVAGAHYAIGPAIEDGFYYDFELPGGAHFSDDDLGTDRGDDARDHRRGPAVHPRRATGR